MEMNAPIPFFPGASVSDRLSCFEVGQIAVAVSGLKFNVAWCILCA